MNGGKWSRLRTDVDLVDHAKPVDLVIVQHWRKAPGIAKPYMMELNVK